LILLYSINYFVYFLIIHRSSSWRSFKFQFKQMWKALKDQLSLKKQSRKTILTAKIARKTSIKKIARKTSVKRKKTSKKYKIKRKNTRTTFDDKLNQYLIHWTFINKKNSQDFARNSTNATKHELDYISTFFRPNRTQYFVRYRCDASN
jgi:C-terminal processing protease CtpA/Prc